MIMSPLCALGSCSDQGPTSDMPKFSTICFAMLLTCCKSDEAPVVTSSRPKTTSSAAFAPAPAAKTASAINAFEDELGAQPPLGFYDPFGMLSGDVTQERFDRLRYVEIKHGRICMLAF